MDYSYLYHLFFMVKDRETGKEMVDHDRTYIEARLEGTRVRTEFFTDLNSNVILDPITFPHDFASGETEMH